MRRTLFVAILLCGLPWNIGSYAQQANYEVLPRPRKITLSEQKEHFLLNASTHLSYCGKDEAMLRNLTFLQSHIQEATGLKVQVKKGTTNTIELSVVQSLPAEGYKIDVSPQRILLQGGSPAGVFYGIQTLFKSLPQGGEQAQVLFPTGVIEDAPRFEYRGYMMDVGRHFFPISYIKKLIDMCALHNINNFHWHLTEDQGWRIEIKKYPKLTQIGGFRERTLIANNPAVYDTIPHEGFYTQAEAKEIVKYAAERYINVTPEVDLPGHMLAALEAYPEMGCTGGPYKKPAGFGVFADVVCGGNPQALQMLKDILSEVMDIFPSKYIHIGGDECPKTRWKECPKCQAKIKELGLKSLPNKSKEDQLQTYVMAQISQLIQERGRKVIGWDEILEGGLPTNDVTVMSWRGNGVKGATLAAQQGHNVIVSPIQHFYFSNPTFNKVKGINSLKRVYDYEPVPSSLSNKERQHIIGAEGCLWTEWTRTEDKVEWQILPRLSALSEVQWSVPERKSFDHYLTRLPKMLQIYDRRGYKYRKDVYDIDIVARTNSEQQQLNVTFNSFDKAPILYTTDGTNPETSATAKLWTPGDAPIGITHTTTIKAVRNPKETTIKYSPNEIKLDFSVATASKISLLNAPHKSYTGDSPSILVDGIYGDSNYRSGKWIGFYGTDADVLLDLGYPKSFSSAYVHSLSNVGDAIFSPTQLQVYTSVNGKDFTLVATQELEPSVREKPQVIRTDSVTFPNQKTRYVRIVAKVQNSLPQWHAMAGKKAFVFIDEIGLR